LQDATEDEGEHRVKVCASRQPFVTAP
jgi:hypothetical protein